MSRYIMYCRLTLAAQKVMFSLLIVFNHLDISITLSHFQGGSNLIQGGGECPPPPPQKKPCDWSCNGKFGLPLNSKTASILGNRSMGEGQWDRGQWETGQWETGQWETGQWERRQWERGQWERGQCDGTRGMYNCILFYFLFFRSSQWLSNYRSLVNWTVIDGPDFHRNISKK